MKSIIFKLMLFLIASFPSKVYTQYTFSEPDNPRKTITATEYIILKPGYHVKAEEGTFYRAHIQSPLLYGNYAHKIWDREVLQLLNKYCNPEITLIEQTPPYESTEVELCFEYDEAGNFVKEKGCSEINKFSLSSFIPEEKEIENITNKIYIYPNPVSTNLTISWEPEVAEEINSLHIVSMAQPNTITLTINKAQNKIETNLSYLPSGIYVLQVNLNSGKTVTKNIIKL